MFKILSNRTFRSLFIAQLVAVLGTGLATIALGLTAFEIAGSEAGIVLGTALAIKMVASVGLAPIAAALAERYPRKTILVALDLVRALVMAAFPFVTEVWQIYVLIFILQAAAAGFTPTLRATIPEILPNERDYIRALSLTQLTYDLESVVSPMLAALLLTFISFNELFVGTVLGFIASAAFIMLAVLPARRIIAHQNIAKRTWAGMRIYLRTPRLRGLLAVTFAASCASAMVIVNTVVLVQGELGLSQSATALALAFYGAGSMTAALSVPFLLRHMTDRTAMLGAAALLATGMLLASIMQELGHLLPILFLLGAGYGAILTPAGRLLRRSSSEADRTTVFAAQFSLTHVCWLINYPMAGWLGATVGLSNTFILLGMLAILSALVAAWLWPQLDPDVLVHSHEDLDPDHEHLIESLPHEKGVRHAHAFVLDDLHRNWPTRQ